MEVEGLTVEDDRGQGAVHDLSLTLAAGEIVGVAGVTGNGQRELSEALAGLRSPSAGRIEIDGKDLAGRSCRAFVRAGVGFVPEDRLGTGLAGSETIWRNAIMRRYGADQLTRGPAARSGRLPRDGEEGGVGGAAVGRGPGHTGSRSLGRARPAPAHRARDGGRLAGS